MTHHLVFARLISSAEAICGTKPWRKRYDNAAEILNPKSQTSQESESQMLKTVLDFDIRICLGFSAWDLGFGAEPLWGLGLVESDCHAWLAENRVDPISLNVKGAAFAAPLSFHRQPSTSLLRHC
jgi:hypothetical protein